MSNKKMMSSLMGKKKRQTWSIRKNMDRSLFRKIYLRGKRRNRWMKKKIASIGALMICKAMCRVSMKVILISTSKISSSRWMISNLLIRRI